MTDNFGIKLCISKKHYSCSTVELQSSKITHFKGKITWKNPIQINKVWSKNFYTAFKKNGIHANRF